MRSDRIMVFLVADCGVNWSGSIDVAKHMIRSCKTAGADAVKFQAFTQNEIKSLKGNPWYKVLKEMILDKETAAMLKDYAEKDIRIEWFCTTMYPEAVDMLEDLKVKRHKIRFKDNENIFLIRKVLLTGKPVMISIPEQMPFKLKNEIELRAENGEVMTTNLRLLYCIPLYPPTLQQLNLSKINAIHTGYSCHLPDKDLCIAAATLFCARKIDYTIEVHVKPSIIDHCIDEAVSFSFDDLTELRKGINNLEEAFKGEVTPPP
jgi:N,N'-diacetyllegionaminate synthase